MGRKAKPVISQEELEDNVILKYINGEEMNLEELATAIWMMDGRKKAKPMTKMGALKTVTRILVKLQDEFKKRGYSRDDFMDIFAHGKRTCASGNYRNSVDEAW